MRWTAQERLDNKRMCCESDYVMIFMTYDKSDDSGEVGVVKGNVIVLVVVRQWHLAS